MKTIIHFDFVDGDCEQITLTGETDGETVIIPAEGEKVGIIPIEGQPEGTFHIHNVVEIRHFFTYVNLSGAQQDIHILLSKNFK